MSFQACTTMPGWHALCPSHYISFSLPPSLSPNTLGILTKKVSLLQNRIMLRLEWLSSHKTLCLLQNIWQKQLKEDTVHFGSFPATSHRGRKGTVPQRKSAGHVVSTVRKQREMKDAQLCVSFLFSLGWWSLLSGCVFLP